ncbi:MAG: sigma-54-dependent Fis family transcriptional regulator [Oleispira sp.]|nr:sigma-54-dependent Fis family transcriptional regulator [Oleispira sp.]
MRILVVEDDPNLREAIVDSLMLKGYQVQDVCNGVDAVKVLAQSSQDIVLSDINMPQMDGLQLLAHVKKHQPWLPMILMTAYGDVGQAVKAMQLGANDYLMKPFEVQELLSILNKYQATAIEMESDVPIAESAESKRLFQVAKKVAVTDSTVLISGESGTGKEVLARFIHQNSQRSGQPFVAINCAAIPENMLEAMLFGYEKGAFTGAYTATPGKFEQANGGTLLLDEITEMDISLQAKLLRVLQEQQVERLGGKKTIDLDVRIIATTNRDLADYVADGHFREDLYYRLSVFPLNWLPLRERQDDIKPLMQLLLQKHAEKMKKTVPQLNWEAQKKLLSHPWPGNVRELDNTVQRALILQQGNEITAEDLVLTPVPKNRRFDVEEVSENIHIDLSSDNALGSDLKQREIELIVQALNEEPSRKDAAERLGISPRTLRYKVAKLREEGIDIEAQLA